MQNRPIYLKHIALFVVFFCVYFIVSPSGFTSTQADQSQGKHSSLRPTVVRVGAFNYYPAIFQDEKGQVRGFYVDMLNEIGERENINFSYVYGSWNDGIDRIKAGEVDLLTSVAYTQERAEFMDYGSTPLLNVWGELYIRHDSPIKTIKDVAGKTIAVMASDHNAKSFREHIGYFGIVCQFVEFLDFAAVLKAVEQGDADGGVSNVLFGEAAARRYDLKPSGVAFNPFAIYFTVAKGKNAPLLQLLDKYLDRWRDTPGSVYYQARLKWKDGEGNNAILLWMKQVLLILGAMLIGSIVFLIVLRVQISRATRSLRESAEALRVAKEKAEADSHAKGEFFTNISHDFRTPLHAILGFSSLLRSANLGEREKKCAEFICSQSKNLLVLVEDILDVAKLETGKIYLKNEPFNFEEILHDAVELLRAEIGKKPISVNSKVSRTIPALKGDAIRLGQILNNLLSNAGKYTASGEISISVDPRELLDGRWELHIVVKDTGYGIVGDKLPRIFDPFTRFHEFHGGVVHQGVGIGLHIVKNLVKLMGGEISVVSVEGSGSAFTVQLPFELA